MARTKGIPAEMNRRIGEILGEVVRDKYEGNQSKAADDFGCSQSHLSNLINGAKSGRGVGLPMLLVLREKTDRTLDDLLGLGGAPSDELANQLRKSLADNAKARGELTKLAEKLQHVVDTAERPRRKRKQWTEAQEVKYRAAAQKIADDKAAASPPAPAEKRRRHAG